LGVLSIKDAFAHSSNVAMAKLGNQYYGSKPQRYIDQLHKLHLNERTHIDIKGERRPVVKSPGKPGWSSTSLPWMAYGYEIQITPLHTCMVYNAVANNGRMMRPYLISAIREYGKDVRTIQPKVVEERIGDSSTIAQLQACLRAVVTDGTGRNIQSPFYTIAGKTGTAQVADKGIKYSDGIYQGSFIGYFPADKPKYTIAVVIRTKPHSAAYYGGAIAAPVFRMIADRVFAGSKGWDGPLDSIARSSGQKIIAQQATGNSYNKLLNAIGSKAEAPANNYITQISTDSNKNIKVQQSKAFAGVVPNVSGMGLKDAVYLLEKEGLQVEVKGRGKVLMQLPAPGNKIIKGQKILLQLS
jgi:cell division protein FtsI (penicillin-binding protein 3)